MRTYEPILIKDIIKSAASPQELILESESRYESALDAVADGIAEHSTEKPFILISGPSGSGKTTTGMKLKEKLNKKSFSTHILSLDNYFHPITAEERPLFEAHRLDLESPLRVDTDLLNSQLCDLMNGKEVILPEFDFVTNTRKIGLKTLRLGKGEFIVLEGIHSLNPSVIENAENFSFGIYVSVRSRIEHEKKGESFLLHPSKIRLARRMIRDGRTRNRTPSATVSIYGSVELGENRYIMPYKGRADYSIDTFFASELSVYKSMLPTSLPDDEKRHPWLSELFEVLAELPAISPDLVPKDSLLREFIGGGIYE